MAEEYFNHWARVRKSEWCADSRAIVKDIGRLRNPGPISVYALKMLEQNKIQVCNSRRYPISVQEEDLAGFGVIIAMSKNEHKPMLDMRWPDYCQQIDYWDVEELHIDPPEVAFSKIVKRIEKLFNILEEKA